MERNSKRISALPAGTTEKLLDPGPGDDKALLQNFGLALTKEGRILGEDGEVSLGRSEEAVQSLERAFKIEDELVHRDSMDQGPRGLLAMAGISLADIVRHMDARRALDIYEHTLRHLAEIRGNRSFQRYEVNVLAGSSYALRSAGRSAEARQRLDGAFERLRQLKLYPAEMIDSGSEAGETLRALADHEAGTGNTAHAVEVYQELLDKLAAGVKFWVVVNEPLAVVMLTGPVVAPAGTVTWTD